MSEPVVEPEHFASSGRGLAAALAALGIYFGLVLVPEWWPGFAGTVVFFLYVLTVPVALLSLLALLLWGIIGAIWAMHRGSSVSRRHRALVVLPLAGFLMFGSVMGLARVIQGALPTGSHLLEFDSGIWQDPRSSEFVKGDITPRQKMLGSVVGIAWGSGMSIDLLRRVLVRGWFCSSGIPVRYVRGGLVWSPTVHLE